MNEITIIQNTNIYLNSTALMPRSSASRCHMPLPKGGEGGEDGQTKIESHSAPGSTAGKNSRWVKYPTGLLVILWEYSCRTAGIGPEMWEGLQITHRHAMASVLLPETLIFWMIILDKWEARRTVS